MSADRSDRPLRIGVMSFAHPHAAGYVGARSHRPDVTVLAADPGPHPAGELRGAAYASQIEVDHVATYGELFDWAPDAVVVTAENAEHRRLVEMAAAAGAHVLVEKPLATTLDDGLRIRDAVERAGVELMVAFPVRFSEPFRKLQAAHRAGTLGRVVAIRGANVGKLPSERSWFTEPELSGGGALVDHVVHIADLIDALTGAAPVSVTAVANRLLHADRARAETAGLVTIGYDDGMIAAIDCSWSRFDSAPSWGGVNLTVSGTAGDVSLDVFRPRVRGLMADTGVAVELPYGPDLDRVLLDVFIAAIRDGATPQPDVLVGLRTLEIVLAAQESARTGRTVRVRNAPE